MRHLTRLPKTLILPILALTLLTASAWGYPSFNNRPVTVTDPGSNSLQSLLDQIFGCNQCVDANADQQAAGMWRTSTALHRIATSVLQFTFPTVSPDIFGIWSDGAIVPIFLGGATGDTSGATLSWSSTGLLTIAAADTTDCGVAINCQKNVVGIDPNQFGFYIQTPDNHVYYTLDQNNPDGAAQAVTYNADNEWVIAFNDTQVTPGSPGAYNNMVVGVQSITALPEPRSIILLGTALLVACGIARRRMHQKV
jgi:hypothetical protein